MRTVVGLYDRFSDAEKAVRDLLKEGFPKEDISVVANTKIENRAENLGVQVRAETTSPAAEGAGVGAVLGGLGGLLMGIGALTIPGFGPIVAAGPLAAAFGGAGVGAAAGGLVGALVNIGIPHEDAELFSEGVRRGGTLVTLVVPEDRVSQAEKTLNQYHPADIHEKARAWQNEKLSSREKQQEERRAEHYEHGHGPSETHVAGSAAHGQKDKQPEHHRETHPEEAPSDPFEPGFHRFYEHRKGKSDLGYGRLREAYEFGYERAGLDRYSHDSWDHSTDELRAEWEKHHTGLRWVEIQDAIRAGWEDARQ